MTIVNDKHKPGSRIDKVHKMFNASGAKAAETLGRELGIADSTLHTWIRQLSNAAAGVEPRQRKTAVKPVKANGKKSTAVIANEREEDGKTVREYQAKVFVPKPKKEKAPKVEGGPIEMRTKKLVTVNYAKKPNNVAYLIEQGPQVSLVRWKHNGMDQALGNEWIGLKVERDTSKTIERGG
jgi:transposase-like protein